MSRSTGEGATPDVTVVLVTVVATAGVLTVAAFAGRWWWVLDLAAAFRPHYAAVLAAAALALVGLGHLPGALVAGVLLVVNAVLVAPLWVDRPAPPQEGAPTLRVVSHNVHGGGDEIYAEVRAHLQALDADLVILLLTGGRWQERLAEADVGFEVVDLGPPTEGTAEVIVLSRVPVEAADSFELVGGARSQAVAIRVPFADGAAHLLGVHTQSPRTGERSRTRDAELAAAAAWARAQDGPAVVIGDLNAPTWSHAFRSLVGDGGLRNSQRGFGLQATWPAWAGPLGVPIDHALHTDELTVVERTVGPALGSSHRSLLVELAPRGETP